ncbi:putative reverse transcriptase domain-containing protein [Tanacetum coccineum]|uniref:Reverse transcriptase domain-containing protein n=1 Tax=Tanacetum coccineum TaxID=301880 RepID=A0ABQ4YTB0_9ASTR
MDEAHTMKYSIHLGANKMYHDLRDMYCWPGMEKDVATYVKRLEEWTLQRLYMDKIVTRHGVHVSIISDQDGRFTLRSLVLWDEIGESRLIRPELVQETTDKVVLIKERLKAARDRQKSYADNSHTPLEFETVYNRATANLKLPLEEIKVDKTLCFFEELLEIWIGEVKKLKCSRILILKVCWNPKHGPEYTWE